MFCTNCGNPLEENAKFCSKCGAPVQAAPAAPEAPTYETPAPEAPAYEAPAPETPAYEAPAPETPAYEAPAPEDPAYETPAPEAPAYEAPQPTYTVPVQQPAPEGNKLGNIFSLISMICGIASITLCWLPFFIMEVPSMAAIALGIVGMIKKGSKGKCITGIILGGIAFFLVIIFGVVWAATLETNYYF